MKPIVIYGASDHSKVVAEIARLNGYTKITHIDDGDNSFMSFNDFAKQDLQTPIAFGIGQNHIRAKLYQKCVNNDIKFITLIHPSAIISETVTIEEGTVVMANAVINADTKIGKACIVNTSCVIEHDNDIGNFVHISPQVACAGNVKIGDCTHIGIGSCIIQRIVIGSDTIIGAGSVVVQNIENQKLAYGNPCKCIKDTRK